jgi:hypothetical protein
MSYFAELDDSNTVVRVVVAESADWCVEHLGGTWVETADPYSEEPQDVVYCGPGFGCDDTWPERFAPTWVQPTHAENAYPIDALVFHEGRIWKNITAANDQAPGVSGWRDTPETGLPMWVQPAGAHDAYPLGAEVTHNGLNWRSTINANVWPPGTGGLWVQF